MRPLHRSVQDHPADLGDGRVLLATEVALLVRLGDTSAWIPRRAIDSSSEIRKDAGVGVAGRLLVQPWFARTRGWVDR
jgi:hypothetical protein